MDSIITRQASSVCSACSGSSASSVLAASGADRAQEQIERIDVRAWAHQAMALRVSVFFYGVLWWSTASLWYLGGSALSLSMLCH